MLDRHLRTPRIALIPIAGLAILATLCAWMSISGSADPMRDYVGHRHPETYVYPTEDVIWWTGALVVEALLTSWILWRAKALTRTCFLAAVFYGMAFLALVIFVMHAPVYFTSHVIWLFLGGAWLVLASIITAVIEKLRATSNPGDSV